MKTESSHPAFPALNATVGLTKREYFAAQALAGHCANPDHTLKGAEQLAFWSVECAAALIDELNRKGADQ